MNLLTFLLTFSVSLALLFVFFKGGVEDRLKKAELKAASLLKDGEDESNAIIKETTTNVENKRKSIQNFSTKKKQYLQKQEGVLNKKEQVLNERLKRLVNLEEKLKKDTKSYQELLKEGEFITRESIERLLKKTNLKQEDLTKEVIESYTSKMIEDAKERISKREDYVKENVEKIAKRELSNVIQRLNATTSVERRSINIKVYKDFMKGKVFGEQGSNIKILEDHFDVYIVFNDLPNTISVSAFNLVQRKKAAKTIDRLLQVKSDITSEVVQKQIELAEKEVDSELYSIGKKALNRMNIKHQDEEFIRTVGRLQYRTSYGQNIMNHSMEVGWVAQMLASAIGSNNKTSLIGGFLHDVGKAIDQNPNEKDCHDLLSKQIMEKAGFSWEETHAAWVHHDAIPQETAEAHLVKAADAVSAARPGARQESFEKYLERIQDLEKAAKSFKFVERAFALSAGRELRVNVNSKKSDDESIQRFAKQLAQKIEEEIVYPGQVKVNVIRRTEFKESTKKHEKAK